MKLTWLIILMLLVPAATAVNYPAISGFVTDNANMIDQSYKEKITQLAQEIEKESTVEIAVVTIDSLDGEDIDMYAVNLFEKWGVGKKDKDNGLLILVAKEDREAKFEVGYGLEGTVTDSMRVNIGERIIVPNFKNGEYGKGIYESMLVVQELLKGNPEVVSQYSMKQGGSSGNTDISGSGADAFGVLFGILFVLVVIFIIFIAIMNASYGTDSSWKRGRVYRQTPGRLPDRGWGMGGGGHWSGGGGFGGGFGGGRSGGGGFGGGFGGFGGGRSGGGGFKVKW